MAASAELSRVSASVRCALTMVSAARDGARERVDVPRVGGAVGGGDLLLPVETIAKSTKQCIELFIGQDSHGEAE